MAGSLREAASAECRPWGRSGGRRPLARCGAWVTIRCHTWRWRSRRRQTPRSHQQSSNSRETATDGGGGFALVQQSSRLLHGVWPRVSSPVDSVLRIGRIDTGAEAQVHLRFPNHLNEPISHLSSGWDIGPRGCSADRRRSLGPTGILPTGQTPGRCGSVAPWLYPMRLQLRARVPIVRRPLIWPARRP